VPGVGAQGGSLQDVCQYGMNQDCGLLVNSSRGIIYASSGIDFAERAVILCLEIPFVQYSVAYHQRVANYSD